MRKLSIQLTEPISKEQNVKIRMIKKMTSQEGNENSEKQSAF